MKSGISRVRGWTSAALFAVFGIGAILISPVMFCLGRPERGQPVVRALWRPLLRLFELTGLIRVVPDDLSTIRGAVIVANHPSLIDVVILVALIPRTLYVAKHALRRNLFMGAVVRATSLPDDASLPERAADYLKKGWNILIFPEGTRTPKGGELRSFHRGAAQVALRTGAPIVCLGLDYAYPLLAKGQPITDMGEKRVKITVRHLSTLPVGPSTGSFHSAAVLLTNSIRFCYNNHHL